MGSGASGGADAAFARGRSSDPGPEGAGQRPGGPWLPWRRAGRGDSCPAPSPAGPPAPDGPRPPAGSRRPAAGEAVRSSFRGAAVPPLAPAHLHAPHRRRPRAPPCGSRPVTAPARRLPCARPPPATAPTHGRAAGAATAVRLRPPRSRLSGQRSTPGRCRRPGALCPGRLGGALCRRARAAGSGVGVGVGTGWEQEQRMQPRVLAPSGSRGQDGESSASQVPVCGRWGSRRAGRGPFRSREESGRVGADDALGERVARLCACVTAPAVRVAEAGRPGAGPGRCGRARRSLPRGCERPTRSSQPAGGSLGSRWASRLFGSWVHALLYAPHSV